MAPHPHLHPQTSAPYDMRAHSAGSAPSGRINPFALEVLAAAGIDAGTARSKSWDEFAAPGAAPLAAVITVCDRAAQETCPYFAGAPVQVHWGYPDPSNAEGGDDGQRRAFELTRQAIGYRMLQLLRWTPRRCAAPCRQ